MKVLFSWYDFLMKEWFPKIIDEYFERMNINKEIHHFYRNNLTGDEEIVWTNESRCWCLDYELFYRKYDKLFYIIREPISAMYNYWIGVHTQGEWDLDFFKLFAENHMIEYIGHYKCHKKINPTLLIYEKIRDDFNYFSNIMRIICPNLNENILFEVYSNNRPIIHDISKFPEKIIDYIKNIWINEGLEYVW